MKKISLFILLLVAFFSQASAQAPSFFSRIAAENIPQLKAGRGCETPNSYLSYRLDYAGIQTALKQAPTEFTAEALANSCQIAIPMADGTLETFGVWQTAIMHPELAANYPEIKTYAGRSTSNSARTVVISTTPRGFRAMIMQPDQNVHYVEPFAFDQSEYYISFDRRNLPFDQRPLLSKSVTGDIARVADTEPYAPPVETRGTLLTEPVELKILRYTVACTGEFGQDHGGTKPLALAAVVEYTNQVSALFERDADLRLQLTPCTENCIFVDPQTDPFFGVEVGDWMAQNDQVVGLICGSATHDVGHVYSRYLAGGAAGVAGGIACTSSKDRGCSSGNGGSNYGDWFLNVVGQEVGHQLSGGHTWNRCNGGGGRAGNSAFEPGSGSTIMSYAGACGPDNIQGSSDLYYQAGSVDEFFFFFKEGAGTTCGTNINTGNNAPEVTIPYQSGFFIPISTPFELKGDASDPDGDVLTLAWEAMSAGPETPLGQPSGNAAIFRSWPASDQKNRYFPKLNTVRANAADITEQLPTYSRDLNFRMIARDNRPGGGGLGWKEVDFRADGNSGPFLVLTSNSPGVIWRVGELAHVTWNVANTNKAPVNCQKVNIRLSLDNGLTFPIMLAENTGNDGSHYVQVPDNVTTNARLRIDAADNVFYDLSNFKFSIQAPTQPSVTLGLSNNEDKICLPENFQTEIVSASVLGYSTPVALEVEGTLPPGAVAALSTTTLQPGQNATLTVDMSDVHVEGEFTFNVKATPQGGTAMIRPITVTLTSNDFSSMQQIAPVNGSTSVGLLQTLRWTKAQDADSYDVQLSDSPAFTNILASQTSTLLDSFKMSLLLEKGKAYYWRVRPKNECGTGPWLEPSFFATFAQSCQLSTATDLPKNITTNNAVTIESKLNVPQNGIINDLNITQIKGFHEYFKDLEVHLISPTGTDVQLFKDKCGNYNGNFNFGVDDAAASLLGCPPPNNGNDYRVPNSLAVFNNQNTQGLWILRVKDNVPGAGGVLEGFQLEFCSSVTVTPPVVVNNLPMPIEVGTNKAISSDLLRVDDGGTPASQLVYTLVTIPQKGGLQKAWGGDLKPGDQFTQADVDAGAMRYFDWGTNSGEDSFRFVVTDGQAGYLGTPEFRIVPFSVGTDDLAAQALEFQIYPNPTDGIMWIGLSKQAETNLQVRVINATGQVVRESTLARGTNRLSLQMGDLPKGLYAIQLASSNAAGVKRVVVK